MFRTLIKKIKQNKKKKKKKTKKKKKKKQQKKQKKKNNNKKTNRCVEICNKRAKGRGLLLDTMKYVVDVLKPQIIHKMLNQLQIRIFRWTDMDPKRKEATRRPMN